MRIEFMKPSRLLLIALKIQLATILYIFLATPAVRAEEIRRQNVTGEGFRGSCSVEAVVNLRSGPSTDSGVVRTTNLESKDLQVHDTQEHNGLWSWATVGSTNAWVKSDYLFDCEGTLIYSGALYTQSRKFLIGQGWQPVERGSSGINSVALNYLRNLGFTEASECSGTGLGLCLLYFNNMKGEELEIITANNDPRSEGVKVYSWFKTEAE